MKLFSRLFAPRRERPRLVVEVECKADRAGISYQIHLDNTELAEEYEKKLLVVFLLGLARGLRERDIENGGPSICMTKAVHIVENLITGLVEGEP